MKLVKSRLALLALALSIGSASTANAALIGITFSGTFNTSGTSVFGQSGDAVPYQFHLTYDTALNTDTTFYAAGSQLGDYTTNHEWHAYSASGIVAAKLNFGTMSWNASQIVPRVVAIGNNTDLWFDTDISRATPTRTWMMFDSFTDNGSATLQIGGAYAGLTEVQMYNATSVMENGINFGMAYSNGETISAVPEPSTYLMMGMGLLALFGYQRRRANRV